MMMTTTTAWQSVNVAFLALRSVAPSQRRLFIESPLTSSSLSCRRTYSSSETQSRQISNPFQSVTIIVLHPLVTGENTLSVFYQHKSLQSYCYRKNTSLAPGGASPRQTTDSTWIVLFCVTSVIGHIGDGFLRVKWPNQQCQSIEGRHKTKLNQVQQNTRIHLN